MLAPKPTMSDGYKGRALFARAKIFAAQCKSKEAFSELEKFKVLDTKEPTWLCNLQLCYGEVYEMTGKTSEALES